MNNDRCGEYLRGPLSYAILEEAYQLGTIGRKEPQWVEAETTTLERVRALLRSIGTEAYRTSCWAGEVMNGATLREDPSLRRGVVKFAGGVVETYVFLTE